MRSSSLSPELNMTLVNASVFDASCSRLLISWITTADILKVADWSSEAVFQKFYHKPTRNNQFGMAVFCGFVGVSSFPYRPPACLLSQR